MKRATAIVVVAALIGSATLAGWLVSRPQSSPQPSIQSENRIPTLTALVANQETESAQAVANYRPKIQTRLADIEVPVLDSLRQLPGVVDVVGVAAQKPTHRIVHLRDWHFVPKELYAIDLTNASGRDLTGEEIDRRHQEHLLEVEAVQIEQMALLRCLIHHHGLKRIFCEGLTAKDMPNYLKEIGVLRDMEQSQISELRQQLADVRELAKRADPNTDRHQKAKKIEGEISNMLDQHRIRLFEIGAPGRLLITGEIEEVLPLEDADTLDKAKPVTRNGSIKLDPATIEARHDAQVKAVMDKGGFGMIVLGGTHDLSDSVRRLGQGRCEYIRITTRRFKEFNE